MLIVNKVTQKQWVDTKLKILDTSNMSHVLYECRLFKKYRVFKV